MTLIAREAESDHITSEEMKWPADLHQPVKSLLSSEPLDRVDSTWVVIHNKPIGQS